MQLGILLAVVAVVMVSESAPREPVGSATTSLLLAIAALSGVVSVAAIGSAAVSRAIALDADRRLTWLALFDRFKQLHLLLSLAVVGVVMLALDWPRMVRYNWGLERIVLVRDILVLAPIWTPLVLSWGAFYEVERAVHRATQSRFASWAPNTTPPFTVRHRFVWLQTRHYLGLCLLPVLALLAYQDLLSYLLPAWREDPRSWVLYLAPLAVLIVGFPHLLSRIWQTSPLADHRLRARLSALSGRMGVRCHDFRVWQTDRQVVNAAVAGMFPACRCVYVTDALLGHLREEELESIVAHELGHVRRRHLLWRMLVLAWPLWVLANCQAFAPHLADQLADLLIRLFGHGSLLHTLAPAIGTVAYAVLALGSYSRLLEHDADLCTLDAGLGSTFLATIDRLSYLNRDARDRSTWLHPSVISRIHLLQRALRDPQVATHFRARVHRVHAVVLAGWILVPLCGLPA